MNEKSLSELYERLIQGTSKTYALIDQRKISHVLKDLNPDVVARMRFSDEYLELLTSEKGNIFPIIKAFSQTYETLAYFYKNHHNIRLSNHLHSFEFHQFLFEHLFSQQQKILLQKMIQEEFSTKKSSNPKLQSLRFIQQMVANVNQKNSLNLNQKKKQKFGQNHLFCELLQCLMLDEDPVIEKKPVEKKQKVLDTKDQEEFSMGKMMSMIM